jgi:hypothetical protein
MIQTLNEKAIVFFLSTVVRSGSLAAAIHESFRNIGRKIVNVIHYRRKWTGNL